MKIDPPCAKAKVCTPTKEEMCIKKEDKDKKKKKKKEKKWMIPFYNVELYNLLIYQINCKNQTCPVKYNV